MEIERAQCYRERYIATAERYILRSPSCRRRHRSSIRSIIRARLDCAGRAGPDRACPFTCALARAGLAVDGPWPRAAAS